MARRKKDKKKKIRDNKEERKENNDGKKNELKQEVSKEKFKTLESIYGSNKLSDNLIYSKTFSVKNKEDIEYYFTKNPEIKNSKDIINTLKKLPKSNVFTNIGNITLEEVAIKIINNAKKTICISSFIIQNNTKICNCLFDASKRGIDIFLLVASEFMMDKLSNDSEGNEHAKEHVQFLKEAGSGYMFIRTGEFHSKFIIVDPLESNAKGLLLTSNLTERALTKNNEVAVLLTKEQTTELFEQFKYGFWTEAKHEYRKGQTSNVASLQSITNKERILKKGKFIVVTTNSSTKTIKEEILKFLKEYNKSDELLISSWNFSLDNDISHEILKYIGVNTKILLPKRSKNFNAFKEFLDKGANIRCNYLQHAKFLVSSNKAIIFSSNFEAQGLDKGFESGIILKNSDSIDALKSIFDNWFSAAEDIAYTKGKKNEYAGKSVEVLIEDEKERSGFRLSELLIHKELIGKQVKEIWSLEDFLKTKNDNDVYIRLLDTNKFHAKSNAVSTNYTVEIRPESVPANVSYLKSVDGFHLWLSNYGKNKEKFLVINKNPLKNENLFNQAQKIAQEEQAKIVIY